MENSQKIEESANLPKIKMYVKSLMKSKKQGPAYNKEADEYLCEAMKMFFREIF